MPVPMTSLIYMDQVKSDTDQKETPLENDNRMSADFLLAEFERLKDVRSEIDQRASRRFQFYITITSAVLGACVILYQTQKIPILPYLFHLTALSFLGYGLITFMNLTFASTFQVRILRASRRIQDYFVDRDPDLLKYLYFSNTPLTTNNSYRFFGVLRRGMAGGSEKSVIAFINGALLCYLAVSFLQSYFSLSFSNITLGAIVIIIFLVSAYLHAVYVTKMYKYVKKIG